MIEVRNTKKLKEKKNKGYPYRLSSGKEKKPIKLEKDEEILTDNWDWLLD